MKNFADSQQKAEKKAPRRPILHEPGVTLSEKAVLLSLVPI
jgi:hypothetical protein